MKNIWKSLCRQAPFLFQIISIGIFFLILPCNITVADPAVQPQGRGVIRGDGEAEWYFGPNRSAEETGQNIPNREKELSDLNLTPEKEKEYQEILDEVYSNPDLGNVRKLFDDWAEQDRLEREGLLKPKEKRGFSPLEEAALRGKVLTDSWIEFWRQFVPSSIYPFPRNDGSLPVSNPWDSDIPSTPAGNSDAAPPSDSTGATLPSTDERSNEPSVENSNDAKSPTDSQASDAIPQFDPNSPEAQEFIRNGGLMGLVDAFMNGTLFNPGGMPPTGADTWNFLPDFKPGESVYENMPEPKEMDEVKVDDTMPISDPEPLQELPEPKNENGQALINGSMPFDPSFGGGLSGVNQEPEEDLLEGLEMAMDSYGHVSVKINGQFIPVNQVTKDQLKAEHKRQTEKAKQPSEEKANSKSSASSGELRMRRDVEFTEKVSQPAFDAFGEADSINMGTAPRGSAPDATGINFGRAGDGQNPSGPAASSPECETH